MFVGGDAHDNHDSIRDIGGIKSGKERRDGELWTDEFDVLKIFLRRLRKESLNVEEFKEGGKNQAYKIDKKEGLERDFSSESADEEEMAPTLAELERVNEYVKVFFQEKNVAYLENPSKNLYRECQRLDIFLTIIHKFN